VEEVQGVGKRKHGKPQLRIDEARRWVAKATEMAGQGESGAVAAFVSLLMGMRASEITTRVPRDLDDGGRLLSIPDAKTEAGKRIRQVPEVLQPYLSMSSCRKPRAPSFRARRAPWSACAQTSVLPRPTKRRLMIVAVADTHALLWALMGDPRLFPAASAALRALNGATGVPLGLVREETFYEISLELDPDDALILGADGIIDPLSTSCDPLGESGLLRRLRAAPHVTANICEALLAADTLVSDDATVLVMQMPARRATRVAA